MQAERVRARGDILAWLCERAPLLVVVHVCMLLRDDDDAPTLDDDDDDDDASDVIVTSDGASDKSILSPGVVGVCAAVEEGVLPVSFRTVVICEGAQRGAESSLMPT